MDTKLVTNVTKEYTKVKHPKFNVGDIIEVHNILKEDGKERIQVFKGIVISIKGSGTSKLFTIRKISYGIGVEKKFPLYSPMIAKIKIVKRAKRVRRSKLYFLRDRVGKAALRAGVQVPAEGEDLETKFEEDKKEELKEEDSESDAEKASTEAPKDDKDETKKEAKEEKKAEKELKNEKDSD